MIHFLAKAVPFRLEFYSDGYEWAPTEGIAAGKGAKIYYFQTTCWSVIYLIVIKYNAVNSC